MAEPSFNPAPISTLNNKQKSNNQSYNNHNQRNNNNFRRNQGRYFNQNKPGGNHYNSQQNTDDDPFHWSPGQTNASDQAPKQEVPPPQQQIDQASYEQPQNTPPSQQQSQPAPLPQDQPQTTPPSQQEIQAQSSPQVQPNDAKQNDDKPNDEQQNQQRSYQPPQNQKHNSFNIMPNKPQNRRGGYRNQYEDGYQHNRSNYNNNRSNYNNNNYNNNSNYNNNRSNYNSNSNYNNNNNYNNNSNYNNRNNYNNRSNYNNSKGNFGNRKNYNSNNRSYNNSRANFQNRGNFNNNDPYNSNDSQYQRIYAFKKIFCIMSDLVKSSTPAEEIQKIQNIGIDLLENPPLNFQSSSESVNPMNAPMNLVDFLIEGLAADQPPELRFLSHKTFSRPTALILNLPIPTPICFSTPNEPNKTQLAFYDTNSTKAEPSQQLAMDVLNVIACRSKTVYNISNVTKSSFSNEELSRFTNECGVVVLKDDINENNDCMSFTLHVLQYDFDDDKEMKVNNFVNGMFENGRISNESQLSSSVEQVYLF